MLAVILIAVVTQPDVPGAVSVSRVGNSSLAAAVRSANDCVVSDDGSTAFVASGRFQSFSLVGEHASGKEDVLFVMGKRGKPYSLTTSQFSSARIGGTPALKHYEIRLLGSASENRLLIATRVDSQQVVSLL